jgi:hypothetical protein
MNTPQNPHQRHCTFVTHPASGILCQANTKLVLITNHPGYNQPMLTEYNRCPDHLGPTIIELLDWWKQNRYDDYIWAVERR